MSIDVDDVWSNLQSATRTRYFIYKYSFKIYDSPLRYCFKEFAKSKFLMEDGTSTCTSVDGTEDFGDNPTRDSLTEGILNLLKPTVDCLENSIKNTR